MSITSETQRKYDPNKGGFSYYTLFHADKGERPSWAQNGDMLEEFGEGGKAYVCSRDAKGRIKWTEKADWDRQTGGGSGGGSLPADFPAEGIANANKFIGFDNSGDYAALDAPSGAEKFVVTLTQDAQTEEWTADKTVAEIVAADEANQVVVAKYPLGEILFDIPLLTAIKTVNDGREVSVAVFGATFEGEGDSNSLMRIVIDAQGSDEDEWDAEATNIKIPNAPLIVTMTEDQQTSGTYVGDKTNKEAYDAFVAGRPVVAYLSAVNTAFSCQAVNLADTTYSIAFVNSIVSEGRENDNVSIVMGN